MKKKLLVIEAWFEDEFDPPEIFVGGDHCDEDCGLCPFFHWDDEFFKGYCPLAGEFEDCPIKRFF